MEKPQIVIQVRGGLVQHISSNSEVEIVLIDWDNIEAGDPYPRSEDVIYPDYTFQDLDQYLTENKPS